MCQWTTYNLCTVHWWLIRMWLLKCDCKVPSSYFILKFFLGQRLSYFPILWGTLFCPLWSCSCNVLLSAGLQHHTIHYSFCSVADIFSSLSLLQFPLEPLKNSWYSWQPTVYLVFYKLLKVDLSPGDVHVSSLHPYDMLTTLNMCIVSYSSTLQLTECTSFALFLH